MMILLACPCSSCRSATFDGMTDNEMADVPEVAVVPAKPVKASAGPKTAKPNARERWRLAERKYSDAVWVVLESDTAVLTKDAHKEMKDLRYAADDRQRKYFKSLKKQR